MNKIKSLNNSRTIQNIFKQKITEVNKQTGEITSEKVINLSKEKKKDSFIKVFSENIDFLIDLTNREKNLLFLALMKTNWLNVITIDTNFRKNAVEICKINRNLVAKTIREMIAKDIFIKLTPEKLSELKEYFKESNLFICNGNDYLINPQLVGLGSFRDLINLRQIVVKDFDFENLTMSEKHTLEAKYKEANKIIENPKNYKIEEINQEKNKNLEKINVIISEKEDNKSKEIYKENNLIDNNGTQKIIDYSDSSKLYPEEGFHPIDPEDPTIRYEHSFMELDDDVKKYLRQEEQNKRAIIENERLKLENEKKKLELQERELKLREMELRMKFNNN